MSFLDTIRRAKTYLQEQGRVSLSALKREFDLGDEVLDELIDELVDVQQVAAREGKVLSWIGAVPPEASAPEPETRATPEASSEQAEAPQAAEAERRQLTVMFCDLVGSTELSKRLDPEELGEVIRLYRKVCAEVVGRYDQEIAGYLGDGLLICFGYPQAHEDDPVRAVRAAISILSELPRLNAEIKQAVPAFGERSLELRIGIHTGLVMAGELGSAPAREEDAIVGETPNLAARLQGMAKPNTVVISDATRRLVRGVFVLEELGSHSLKGIAEPVPVFRVLRASGVQSRLELAGPGGLTPLVGRVQEVALLLDRWEQVNEGHGQVMLLSGEAGMGKSRLVQVLHQR